MIKRCKMCGIIIADSRTCDIHRWSALKYCTECAKISERQNTAERLKRMRKRKAEIQKLTVTENDLLRERIELLQRENAKLRRRLEVM